MQEEETDVVVKLKTDRRGILNPQVVRWIAFIVITVSLVACTVLCILAIWKFTESDAVWRAIATFIVVSIATADKVVCKDREIWTAVKPAQSRNVNGIISSSPNPVLFDGYGATADAYHLSSLAPGAEGSARSMRGASSP